MRSLCYWTLREAKPRIYIQHYLLLHGKCSLFLLNTTCLFYSMSQPIADDVTMTRQLWCKHVKVTLVKYILFTAIFATGRLKSIWGIQWSSVLLFGPQFARLVSLQWRHLGSMASQSPASRLFTQLLVQGADQTKHQSSASLAFVRGIHWWLVNSPHKGPVMRKRFPFHDVIMCQSKIFLINVPWDANIFIVLQRDIKPPAW